MNNKSTMQIPLRTSFPQRHMHIGSAITVALAVVLSGCTSTPKFANHTFEFNALTDSKNVEIIDYRYGASSHPGARACQEYQQPCDKRRQQAGIHGGMRVGDDLFVKWQVRSSNKQFQEIVSLKDKLPENLENHRIRFIVEDEKLFVYLILPEKIIPNPCPDPDTRRTLRTSSIADVRVFSLYCSAKILRIHPTRGVVLSPNQKGI